MSARSKERAAKRSSPLSLRLSAEERERIERDAGTVPIGTYIKSRVFREGVSAPRVHARNPKAEHRTLAQLLARLGASQAAAALRELADAARSGSLALDPDTKALIDRACGDVIAMRDMLMRALGLKVDAAGARRRGRRVQRGGRKRALMILKGSQRAGAAQLARHLLNRQDNDHVIVHELRGFVAGDLKGALHEADAISRGTRCTQFMFSLSLNPPKQAAAGERDFIDAADRAEKALGLDGQPRAIVIHEKEGRRHAHVVWSRIDAESMRAINLPHFKRKLTALSRELYLNHGWTLPDGLRSDGGKNPLNFSLEEYQRAKRLGVDPREIKATIRDALERSDSAKALSAALKERGLFLAQGDQRGFVVVDLHGNVHALARRAGVRTKELRTKLGEPDALPSVSAVREDMSRQITAQMRGFIKDVRAKQKRETDETRAPVATMRAQHDGERQRLKAAQQERWDAETKARAERFRRGLGGLWDKLTGKASATRRANDAETAIGLRRDADERDRLALAQIEARRILQAKIEAQAKRHATERKLLARQITETMRLRARPEVRPPEAVPPRQRRRGVSLEL